MPQASIRDRLTRLGAAPRPRPQPPVRVLPRGFQEITTRFGPAMLREDVIPLPALDPHPGNVAYLDTETTGLHGGSGTLAFVAAVARPIDCGLRVAQIFLPQPGMEPAFLEALRIEIYDAANALGIGAQGLGGLVTALAVNVEVYPTHIAGLPVAVNLGCHSTRRMSTVL